MKLTAPLIAALAFRGMPPQDAEIWATKLGAACVAAEIVTPLRLAHFLAQVTHESGGLYYMQELWGPTAAQRGYEGRADLGNTQPGDGRRYMGRGPLQLTGRANYRATGQRIGHALEAVPELASQVGVGSLVAADFWSTRHLNALADQGGLEMVQAITRKVNGGLNGLPDRQRRFTLAAQLLST